MQIKTDSLGIPHFSDQDLIELIYKGHANKLGKVLCDPSEEVEKCNNYLESQGLKPLNIYQVQQTTKKSLDELLQKQWFMPEKYQNINVLDYLLEKCKTPEETQRVNQEYQEYSLRNLVGVLQYMIFLVDFMREHDIVWGVGRGSSVASFILYLIGIHRINSIQYDLDFYEFMR